MSEAIYTLQKSLGVTCDALRKLSELYPEDERIQRITSKALNYKEKR